MITLLILFGTLTLLAGAAILINPGFIFHYLRKHYKKPALHVLAVGVRLLLGVLLISQASLSKFPLAIEVLGWLSIIAALTFAAIGRGRFVRLMSWALNVAKPFGRVGGVFAAAFGAFLIYAFV